MAGHSGTETVNAKSRLRAVLMAATLPLAVAWGLHLAIAPASMIGGVALLLGTTAGALILAWRMAERRLLAPLVALNAQAGASLAQAEDCRAEVLAATKARGEAEEALQYQRLILRSMVSALPVGVIAVDRHARVEVWNHAAEEILGYSAGEMVGKPAPAAVFKATEGEQMAANVFLRMVTGQLVKSEEVRCRRKDGVLVETSFSGAPLMDEDERVRGAICVFEDISQRKAVAWQLHQAQKMEAVGQLTGGMAHDFNNILGVAIGNLDLLDEELTDRPEAAELAQAALNALLRGAELTRALLAFSRRQPLQPSRLEVARLLSGMTRMLSRTLGEHIQVELHTTEDLWPIVVDAAQLEAAITNLAINARDAMREGGRLVIEAHNVCVNDDYVTHNTEILRGDYVLVEISDTGSGMSPEVLAHAFEPFFTTKAVGQGTGLGLSMVYGFLRQSGGHIRIYSELGLGTTVRLYLPRAALPAQDTGSTGRGTKPPLVGGTETVLVVEDNDDVRRVVEGQLKSLGYHVLTAPHGHAAMEILEAGTPIDLLFTDVVMPHGMNGFTLAEAARKLRPELKVLFTSGFPGTTIEPPAGSLGPLQFLCKPYRRQDLARSVRDSLSGPSEAP